MNSQQDVIYGLMNELEEALERGFPILGYCFTVVKKDTVTSILDKLYAALPDEIKEQVIAECEDIKRKALEEADALRNQSIDEALRTKDGASIYAEQVLVDLEQNLNKLQEVVKNGQLQLERRRAESDGQMAGNYANQRPEFARDFRMN